MKKIFANFDKMLIKKKNQVVRILFVTFLPFDY